MPSGLKARSRMIPVSSPRFATGSRRSPDRNDHESVGVGALESRPHRLTERAPDCPAMASFRPSGLKAAAWNRLVVFVVAEARPFRQRTVPGLDPAATGMPRRPSAVRADRDPVDRPIVAPGVVWHMRGFAAFWLAWLMSRIVRRGWTSSRPSSVFPGHEEPSAVGEIGDSGDRPARPSPRDRLGVGAGVPELDRLVGAGGGQAGRRG